MRSEHPARDTGVSAARTDPAPTARSRGDARPAARAIALGAGAILLLGAVCVAALALVLADRPRPSAPSASFELAPEPVQQLAPVPAPPPGMPRFDPQASRRLQELPPPPVIHDEPPPTPPKGSWEEVKVTPRPAALGALGGALGRELNELEPKLAACFDEDTQARYAQHEYTTVRDYARSSEDGMTVLLLEVETLQGALRIVDAPVDARGGASDGLIACAQRVLRGHVVPVPGTRAGSRHRVQFPLQH